MQFFPSFGVGFGRSYGWRWRRYRRTHRSIHASSRATPRTTGSGDSGRSSCRGGRRVHAIAAGAGIRDIVNVGWRPAHGKVQGPVNGGKRNPLHVGGQQCRGCVRARAAAGGAAGCGRGAGGYLSAHSSTGAPTIVIVGATAAAGGSGGGGATVARTG